MTNKKGVCVVDTDPAISDQLTRMIRSWGYATEAFQSGKEFLNSLTWQNQFCVIFDINTPDLNGLDVQRVLVSRNCILSVIFIAAFASVSVGVEAMREGAIDFIIKPPDEKRLRVAIEKADQRYQQAQATYLAINQFNSLTMREQEVFKFVTKGLLNKQIAAQLGIAEKTIKVHRGRVMKKLGVHSVPDLMRLSEKLPVTQEMDRFDKLSDN